MTKPLVTRYIIVMRRKALVSVGGEVRPEGKRLYRDDSTTSTARHRATLFREYELLEELETARAVWGDRMYSIEVEKVQVPEGARTLGHEPPEKP